jgi:hypothetical protein
MGLLLDIRRKSARGNAWIHTQFEARLPGASTTTIDGGNMVFYTGRVSDSGPRSPEYVVSGLETIAKIQI